MESERKFAAGTVGAQIPTTDDVILAKYADFFVTTREGLRAPLDFTRIKQTVAWAAQSYDDVDPDVIVHETVKNIFDGIPQEDLADALILGATACIERDPAYSFTAGRLLFKKLFREVTDDSVTQLLDEQYRHSFIKTIEEGVSVGLLDAELLHFDLNFLARQIKSERDHLFDYMGLRTLYERYFLKQGKKRIELPQSYWMRIAMGLSLQ